jgi:hypothetical protein
LVSRTEPRFERVPTKMHVSGKKKIVLLGMMSQMPVAGVVWQTLHYLVGFQRLGYDVYYVEAHARTPTMLMQHESDDSSTKAVTFISDVMRRFDFDDRWAFHALHDNGECYGLSQSALNELYRSAHLIINLHGGTKPLPEHVANGRLVYLETDPVQLQIELHNNEQWTIDFLEPHIAYFTFGENYGRLDCKLPVSDRFRFKPTRQPVVLDFWDELANGMVGRYEMRPALRWISTRTEITSLARAVSSPWPRTRMSGCGVDGSATEAQPTWPLAGLSSLRKPVSATFCRRAKDYSRFRRWTRVSRPLTILTPIMSGIAALRER